MESDVGFACAVGNALVRGKDLKELLELQVSLQLISSIVNGAIQSLRLSGTSVSDPPLAPG